MQNIVPKNSPYSPVIKPQSAIVVLAALCGLVSTQVYAEIDGRSGRSGKPPANTCATGGCHSPGAPTADPAVAFTAPATSVVAGSTTTYTVTINAGTAAGAPASAAAINVAASAGTFVITDAQTKLSDATTAGRVLGEVVHTAPKPMAAGAASYTFSWIAPTTPGPQTLYVAGMATNGDGADGAGDGTTQISLPVTVTAAATPGTPPAPGANQPPVARIAAPATGTVGTAITFSGTTSSDPDVGGSIASYSWNFGDNTAPVTGATATKTYTAPGNYTVALTVTDNGNVSNTATQPITISAAGGGNLAPTANTGGPYTGTVNVPVSFNGSASRDPDGTIGSYAWTFGDTTGGTGMTTSKTYTQAGTYTVTLIVTDNANATGTATTTATITAPAGTPPVTPPPPPVQSPTAPQPGQQIYVAKCESCHGVNAAGTAEAKSVVEKSFNKIVKGIFAVPDMNSLSTMTIADVSAVADFLAWLDENTPAPTTPPTTVPPVTTTTVAPVTTTTVAVTTTTVAGPTVTTVTPSTLAPASKGPPVVANGAAAAGGGATGLLTLLGLAGIPLLRRRFRKGG